MEETSSHNFMMRLTKMLQAKLDEQLKLGFKAYEYSFIHEPKTFKFNEPSKIYKVVVFDPDLYKMIRKEEE